MKCYDRLYLFSSKITHKNIKPEGQQGSEALTAARNKKMFVCERRLIFATRIKRSKYCNEKRC